MAVCPLVATRIHQPEIMDDPGLDESRHAQALAGLRRLNFLSQSVKIVWRPIRQLARDKGLNRLRILDLATGAGDVPIGLWRQAKRHGIDLDIEAMDVSPRAVRLAERRAKAMGSPVRFRVHDVLNDALPAGFDVAVSSLFLHHLDEVRAARLLEKMASAARRLVLVNDLRRSCGGLLLAFLASRLFTMSQVVRVDALRSVRAAFTTREVQELAERAGLRHAIVARQWPFRFLLSCERT